MRDREGEESVDGTLSQIVFHNPENHFTVARLDQEGGGEITVVGTLIGLQKGAPLSLRGEWVVDKRFGRQFKVSSYQVQSPQTLLGIERYLSSGLIQGIGPELAKRIVAEFGLKTFDVIGRDPNALTRVEGIGPARAAKISDAWKDQKEIQDVMVFLRGHGVSAAFATRIYKRYGKDAIDIVQANPYRLALDIWGIGFKSADQIARNLGIARDAAERIEAGTLHLLGQLSEDGHVHAPTLQVIQRAQELLGVRGELIEPAIDRLIVSRFIVRERLPGKEPTLALVDLHNCECQAAESFVELCTHEGTPLETDADTFLQAYEEKAGITLAPQQREAVAAGIDNQCVIITGGPGVGKTTIVRALVDLYDDAGLRIELAAPTGRAAKRLSESTERAAQTLHRLLEFQPRSGGFERSMENPIETDVLIVDEFSMVDIKLFRALVAALLPGTRLIMVGDVDQLPSVGPGAVLSDLIRSEAARVVMLTEIFRQAATSKIITNAHRVNHGELPELQAPAGTEPDRSDFYFIEREDPIAAQDTLVELVCNRIPKRFGFDSLHDVQVLTPMHRGEMGTMAINARLQEALAKDEATRGQTIKRGQRSYRIGDKVMQIRNDYDRDVFNGDVGIVSAVEPSNLAMEVQLLDGRTVRYEQQQLDDLVHAFAISVHKSQGSEYPCVVIPLLTQHYMMLQRNLLYTALTRGKKLVILIGSSRAVSMAVRNQSSKQRWTYLAERIRDRLGNRAN